MGKPPEKKEVTPLIGKDYMTLPIHVLTQNRGFSQHAYRVIEAISKMTTEEIEKIDLNPRRV